MRKPLIVVVAALLLLAGCTSGNSNTKTTDTSNNGGTSGASSAEAARAPGVTANTIKIGVTYVDEKSLQASGLTLDLGDYKGSYQALVDQINAAGGIDGRKIELTFAPINPVGTAPATTACLQLTEDTKVFAIVGFFLTDAVLCPVQQHDTAVIGGTQTNQLLAEAQAPWFTVSPGSEVPVKAVDKFHEQGLLTGKVGVFAQVADQSLVDDQVMPELKKLGVDATKAILDAPAGDQAAVTSGTQTIAQRFQSEGIKKVVLVGDSSADWFVSMESQSYKPQLLISDSTAVQAFLGNKATSDTSLLDNSVEAQVYSIGNFQYDEPNMQACFKTLKAAGVSVPQPDPSDANKKGYTGPEDACSNLALLKAILEKAGKDLNYATFRDAGYHLGAVSIPGDPNPRHYGPPPATDGDPTVQLLYWSPSKKDFVTQS
jgi:ABC-type branched-subunit amino acid transport system substrate-binding protein